MDVVKMLNWETVQNLINSEASDFEVVPIS